MNMGVDFISILALAAIVVVVAIVVGLVAILVSFKRRGETQSVAPPAQAAPPDGEERQAVLKKLAAGELSKEQAEAQLDGLGTKAMPAADASMTGGR